MNVVFLLEIFSKAQFTVYAFHNKSKTHITVSIFHTLPVLSKHTVNVSVGKLFTGAREDVPRIGIVITDGVSTYDSELTIPEALKAKNKRISMFAVGE